MLRILVVRCKDQTHRRNNVWIAPRANSDTVAHPTLPEHHNLYAGSATLYNILQCVATTTQLTGCCVFSGLQSVQTGKIYKHPVCCTESIPRSTTLSGSWLMMITWRQRRTWGTLDQCKWLGKCFLNCDLLISIQLLKSMLNQEQVGREIVAIII